MSTIEQQARIELSLNAQKATDKLNELTKEAAKLNKELQNTEKGTKQYEKLEKQLNAVEKNMRKTEKAAFDVNKVLDNLSGASINDINKAIKEMTRQMNDMDRSSDKWRFYKEQVERAKEELKKISSEGKQSESWLSRFNNKFAKWGSLIATGVAGFTGLTLTVQKFRQMAMEKESSQANLKALTGLDDQSIAWLTKQAEQLSTTMHESGLRVRQSSQEILDAYTLVGSAKPELLNDKEALNAVTIEAMRLAEAARMDLNQAVDAVTLSMNQYGASANEAARYTNVMAAGSKYGSAAVQSVTTAVKNAGVAASAADIPIEALVGSIETLAEKGIKDEVAGTGLKTFFLKLEGMSEDVRPSVVGLQTALENLNAKGMDSVEMQKAFGLEAYTVAQAMISGADKVKYYTEAVTGTNVAVEQAIINSDTAEAKRAQTINKIKEVGIELGQRLTPMLTASAKASTVLMKGFLALLDACEKYKISVIALVSAITAMTIAKNKDIIVSKLSILWNQKLVGSIKAVWTAMLSNPITAIVAAFTVLIGVVADFVRKTIETNKEIKALNNTIQTINQQSNQNIAAEKDRLNDLLKIARDEWRSKKERAAALTEINKISPEYLGNLTLETVKTKEGAAAIQRYVDNLLALEKLKEATSKRNDLRDSLQQQLNEYYEDKGKYAKERFGIITVDQLAEIGFTNIKSSNAQKAVYNDLFRNNKELKAMIQAFREVNHLIEQQNDIILKNQIEIEKNNKVESAYSSYHVSDDPANKDEANKYSENEELKKKLAIIEANLNTQLALEETAYVTGQKTEKEHLETIRKLKEDAIIEKQELYKKDSKNWAELEAEKVVNLQKYEQDMFKVKKKYEEDIQAFVAKYQEKSLDEKKQEELAVWDELYNEKEKKDETYYRIRNEIIKKYEQLAKAELEKNEKELQENRKKGLQDLREAMGDSAKGFGIDELVENGTIDPDVTDKLIDFYKNKKESKKDDKKKLWQILLPSLSGYKESMADLNKLFREGLVSQEKYAEGLDELFKGNIQNILSEIASLTEKAWSQISSLMNAGSELLRANMDLEVAKINQRYDVQLKRAEGNEEETKKLEEKKEAEIARVKTEYNKRQMKMQMAQTVSTSIIAALNAWASAMSPAYAPFNLLIGGVLSGIIAAQTAIQIAALKKQHEAQAAGYYSGGYTSHTLRDTDPAGIVHGNEFVVNARAVRNPAIRPMLDFIDTAQRNNYISRITSSDIARAAGTAPVTTVINNNSTDTEALSQVIAVINKLSNQLDKPIVAETYITGKGGSLEANKLYDKMMSNASRKI